MVSMFKKLHGPILCLALAVTFSTTLKAQQIADASYNPPINEPAYQTDRGPLVLLDEGHFNLHIAGGRYQPFAQLLRRDGYVVRPSPVVLTKEIFKGAQILVIASAVAERNSLADDWSLPTPSAFTDQEIKVVREWVKDGGALFLIADHMPFSGGAQKLAAAFGVELNNGFARDPSAPGEPIIFRRSDGLLKEHSITRGRSETERIDQIATFTGAAFRVDRNAHPLLVFGPAIISLMPRVAWDFRFDTPRISVGGWYQGAALRFGKGRVAVFGDATMFTAQLRGPGRVPLGMNEAVAPQNAQFLLNVAHWLSGLLGE
jgi:hypothetical protein